MNSRSATASATGPALGRLGWIRRSGQGEDGKTAARLSRLLSEARDLCRQARTATFGATETTAGRSVAIAFQSTLAGKVRRWLREAEFVVKATTADQVRRDASLNERLEQLRYAIDIANAAMVRRSGDDSRWEAFYSILHDRRV